MNIKKYIELYINGVGKNKGRNPVERYASFDYCYNYFYSFYQNGTITELAAEKNVLTGCLHLGFYLASWGMMRGSSFLLEKSVAYFQKLIEIISKMDKTLWEIDLDNYSSSNIKALVMCKGAIYKALGPQYKPSDTLITKIMLGVFANIPAFDTNFKNAIKVYSMNEINLNKISRIYLLHKSDFDYYYNRLHTLDFFTSNETVIKYTRAKIFDMFGFMAGQERGFDSLSLTS